MSPSNIINDDSTPSGGACQALNIGDRLRAIRFFAGVSQDELAVRAGIDQATISRVERGVRQFSEEQRARIAEALGADPERLFGR